MAGITEDEAFSAIIASNARIWETDLDGAAQKIKPFRNLCLSAMLHDIEIHMWRNGLDASDEHYDIALEEVTKGETYALEQHALYARDGALSATVKSVSGFFKTLVVGDNDEGEDSTNTITEEARVAHLIEVLSVLADLNGSLAMLLFRKQNRVKVLLGAYRMKKAWNYYSEAFNLIENTQSLPQHFLSSLRGENIRGRVLFGVGFFNYMVSMIPPTAKFMVELLGFEGDRDKAVAFLEKASSFKNSPRGAKFFFEDDKESAMQLLEELETVYPRSAVLQATKGQLCRRTGRLLESTSAFEAAVELAENLPQFQRTQKYELGHNLFLQNRWKDVIPYIEDFLETTTSEQFKVYGAYKLGICYWMTKTKVNEIAHLYEKLKPWVRPTMAYECYALRKSSEFLEQQSFSPLETLFISVRNHIEAENYRSAKETVQKAVPLLKKNKTADEFGMFLYLKGVSLHHLKEEDDAINHFKKVLSLQSELKTETWIVPYAEVELCDIYLKRGEKSIVETFLQSAKGRSDYDFHKQCSMKIKKINSKLAKMR